MKFMIVVLFAVVLAANAKVVTLVDMNAYEQTNAIGDKAPVAKQTLNFKMAVSKCEDYCEEVCLQGGFTTGVCVDDDNTTFCHCT